MFLSKRAVCIGKEISGLLSKLAIKTLMSKIPTLDDILF